MTECLNCAGCGQVANDSDRTPWKYWTAIPSPSNIAVSMGIVKPMKCESCNGTGQVELDFPDTLTVQVEQRHIALGEPMNPIACPMALAIKEKLHHMVSVSASANREYPVHVRTGDVKYDAVNDDFYSFVDSFDAGIQVHPATFTFRRVK